MDLGLGLDDDDIFDNCHRKTKEPCKEPYSSRLCPELWFNAVDISNVDVQTVTKYRGDWAYQEEQYESALLTFQRCHDHIQPNNVTMRRGVEEDKARCYLRLGQPDAALVCARNVVALAQNFEQVTAALVLLLDVYKATCKTAERLCALKKLLLLHPNNSRLWIDLGDLYSSTQTYDDSFPRQTDHTRINGASSQVKPSQCILENSQTTQDGEFGVVTVAPLAVESREKLDYNDSMTLNPSSSENNCISSRTKSACDQNESVPVEMNGQIVAAGNAGNLLDRFGSMSCNDSERRNEKSLRRGSWERDRLAIRLTCFVAARLLLRSVHCRLNSFAKTGNEEDQLKVESRLDLLLVQPDIEEQLQRCSEFLKVALNLTEADESMASTNRICDMTPPQVLCEDERCMTTFDRKWFSWMKVDALIREQYELKSHLNCLKTSLNEDTLRHE